MNGIQIQLDNNIIQPAGFVVDFKDGIPVALYNTGAVLDIRPSKNGAPNRIQITGMKLSVSYSEGYEWIYKCLFESDHAEYIIHESALIDMVLPMSSPVYKSKTIKERYESGWRFYGNMTLHNAKLTGNKLAGRDNIAHVRICEAYDNNGKLLSDGRVALWIQYQDPISGGISSNVDIMIK